MIDFRYHLVSIVSIFLALAVGIVLGAGPLKEELGTTLTQQVQTLRTEKDTLEGRAKAAENLVDDQDAFESAALPALIGGRLTGQEVVLVVLPTAPGAHITATRQLLTQAGATLTATVTLRPAWFDPAKSADRSALATRLVPEVGVRTGELTGAEPLQTLLASALSKKAAVPRLTVDHARKALDAMVADDLIALDTETFALADSAVVVAGMVTADDPEVAKSGAALQASLAAQLDAAALPTVVASQIEAAGITATAIPVVQSVRAGADAENVSTVDNLDSAMGRFSVVGALLQQIRGGAGQYGLLPGASSAFAPLPAG